MKKGFILVLLLSCFFALKSDAIIITASDKVSIQRTGINYNSIPYGNYLRYYIIDNGRLRLTFKKLSPDKEKDFERTLTKEQKQDYKYAKKVQELADKGAWGQALYKYPNYYPLLVQYYNNCIEKQLYEEALRILDKIRYADRNYQIFSKDVINRELGTVYMKNKQYEKALEVFKLYENTEKWNSEIAQCYYNLGDYKTALGYIKKIKDKNYNDYELLYNIYIALKDTGNAHQTALTMCNLKYNFENVMRAQKTSRTNSDRLKYAYQARNSTMNEGDVKIVNQIIADIEQKNIEDKVSRLKQFVKVPKWSEFIAQLPPDMTGAELSNKQDEFFKTANDYLNRYEGQQLTNAFNSLNQDMVNYVAQKQAQYYQQQQLEAQQALREAQERANYIRQQQIYQQEMMRRQQQLREINRIYYLQNRSYYSNPLMYDPFW